MKVKHSHLKIKKPEKNNFKLRKDKKSKKD